MLEKEAVMTLQATSMSLQLQNSGKATNNYLYVTWLRVMGQMSLISIFIYRLKEVTKSCFTVFKKFKELFISLQPDIQL